MARGPLFWSALLTGLALVVAACGATGAGSGDGRPAAVTEAPDSSVETTIVEYYPDANIRELWRRMARPRPVPNSALPPRHLDLERFPETLVDRNLIVSGGPPPDGIPSIDDPSLVAVDDVDWLAPDEAVLVLRVGDVTRIYPVQIMLWHEIVNDRIGDSPITVSYCPLCNSALAYDRRVGDRVLDFGTSGSLYQSALVMYDRQTESLWTHFDGRAVVGELLGAELELHPVMTTSWADAVERWPDAEVLDRPGTLRRYGTNPYPGYEGMDEPLPGFFTGEADPRLGSRTRVIGLRHNGEAVAVERSLVEAEGSLTVEVGGLEVRLEHRPGVRSPLDGTDVAGGVDIGSVSAVVEGPASAGDGLDGSVSGGDGFEGDAVPMLDTFWFAWAAYNPETTLVDSSSG